MTTTRFTDDWSVGTTWDATKWTTSVTGTSATIDILSGEGRITLPNGTARYVYGIDTITASANQEVLVKVRGDQTAARANYLVIGVAMSGIVGGRPSTPTDGVYLKIGPSTNAFALNHVHGGTITNGPALTSARAAYNSTFWVRLQHVNGIVNIRTWTDGSAEPSTWNDTVDITGFTALPAGHVVLGAETTASSSSSETYYFDSLTSTDGAPAIVNSGYTAQAMTASGTMPAGNGITNGGYTAQAMTASATMVDPTWSPRTLLNGVSQDASIFDDAPTGVFNGDTARIQKDAAGLDYYLVDLTNPLPGTTMALASVKVKLTGQAASTGTLTPQLYKITSGWNETTVTYNTRPTMTLVEAKSPITTAAGVVNTIDLTNTYNAGATNGVAITSSTIGAGYWYTKEAVTSTNRPVVEWTFVASSGATVVVTVLSGSGLMPDPVISTSTDVSASGQPMTASVALVDPTITAEKFIDVIVSVAPMTATASMPANSGWSESRTVAATALTGSVDIVAATVATTKNVNWFAKAMTGTATEPYANITVNGNALGLVENDDAYFNRVSALSPRNWWRLNDKTTNVKDRVGGKDGTYNSVQFGRLDGPQNRASAHFDGTGYISENIPIDSSSVDPVTRWTHTALEFTFRTTNPESYLMYSGDDEVGLLATIEQPAREIYLSNGHIVYKTYVYGNSLGGPASSSYFTGRTNLSDGDWHHVVINGFSGNDGHGVEVWIDGKFEVRRYNAGTWYGMPDYVGGAPGISMANYLVGDMSEIVFYNKTLTNENISRNYYAVMGWVPIEVPSMTATAMMPDGSKGRGNQKKALYLYWDTQSEVFRDSDGQMWQTGPDDISFDPIEGFASNGGTPITDYHGFKVYARPITNKGNPGIYRDPWTDEQSYIDLERDVDLNDYDVIMFKDWPDESNANPANIDNIEELDAAGILLKERLLNQLRDANDRGIGLYVTHPRLAVDLGIIDRVEYVSSLSEGRFVAGQGNASGMYDYGSAVEFPWNVDASDGIFSGAYGAGTGAPENTDPAYLSGKAYFYYDTHKNNRFRVRALVDNLTSIPSYMIEDAVFHVDYDPWGNQGVAYKYLHRMNGLQIGDEYIFNGSAIISPKFQETYEYAFARPYGTWATPMADVKAGTVVTTFGSKVWQDTELRDNPYADYATTIVVQPGDVLNGREVKGKIFCNFSEAPSNGLGVTVQVLPGSEDDINNPLRLDPNDVVLTDTTPLFHSMGTPEQNALLDTVIARTTFPYDALKGKINARYGRSYIPVLWQDIDPGTSEFGGVTLAEFVSSDGTIIIDEKAIRDTSLSRGISYEENLAETFIHETAHMVDRIYLQPYQRVNIWNAFHGDWNTGHTAFFGKSNADFILPADYVLNPDDKNIIQGEGWLRSDGGQFGYFHARIGEAFANAFVKAYSDYSVDTHQYDPHPAPPTIGPLIRAAIESGAGAYIFNEEQAATGWPTMYPHETAAQREWEYSWTRTSATTVSENLPDKTVTVVMPNGTTQQIQTGHYGGYKYPARRDNVALSMTRTTELFPLVGKPRWEMDGRGMYWLSIEEHVEPGGVNIKAAPMTATAEMETPVVTAQHDAQINAQAMLGIAVVVEPAEAPKTNATVLAFPMEGTAVMNGVGTTIQAAPMTGTATIVDNFDMVHANGEYVVLTLHGYDATLFIKEEA